MIVALVASLLMLPQSQPRCGSDGASLSIGKQASP
jgi:hypothetical protein